MLTTRGWWFLIVVTLVLGLGATVLTAYSVVPALLCLTLLAWFLLEWIVFHVRVNAAASRLKVSRRVIQGDREVPMVWSGLEFAVHVQVGHDSRWRLPLALFEDRLPQAARLVGGENELYADVSAEEPAGIRYSLLAPSPGVLRFEGVKVRIADFHGFFFHRAFLHDETEYLILPPLADDEGKQRADKRFNTLPPPGIHRLRRPGSGGELLDLRDYRPGDPPKMIAWKASARRDRLITKEYESDVPVRCMLFLDTTDGMRLGPPAHTPLAHMSGIASGIAQASAGNRDLVGLSTFDEREAKSTSPARTKLHMIGILRRLAEAAALQPSTLGVPTQQLTARAFPLAQEIYPELMNRRVNSMPLGRLWLPMLDRWWGWIVLLLMASPILVPATLYFGTSLLFRLWIQAIAYLTIETTKWWGGGPVGILPAKLFFFLLCLYLPCLTGLLVWGVFGIRGWFGERKLQLTRRKQLAALFALSDCTGPAGIERLIHDDEEYSRRIGRFLQDRQVRMPVPLYDNQGRYRFRCAGKARVLAEAMARAVGLARDNELYVILADLVELGGDLAPLLRAIKLARARRHQVMIIVPWPADMPPPRDKPRPKITARPRKKQKGQVDFGSNSPRKLLPMIQGALTRQYHESFRQFRHAVGEVGATVVRVNEDDPVQLVLDRLDRLRGMRSRR